MIYLFDDNEFGQMSSNYNVDILKALENYSDIIKHYEEFPNIETVDQLIPEASMIFIHYSFSPPEINSRICFLAEQNNIPLVIFSGQEVMTLWDENYENIIRLMKKDRFYYNLIPFLENYKKAPQKATVKTLVYGEEYEIERSIIIQNHLHKVLLATREEIYEQIFPSGSRQYKDLFELFYLAYGNVYENQFSLFADEAENKPYYVEDIMNKINELVSLISNRYE